ncbi:DUF4197 domain-containing protein [Candidatus Litorirhabdus singularis]|nr:DUF4197 domain-containing protein [Candidatus Litorirhabdus singularis]
MIKVAYRILLGIVLLCSGQAQADWKDLLDTVTDTAKDSTTAKQATAALGLSEEEVVLGLKEALNTSTRIAVETLGKQGGFMDNPLVRIPLPEELEWVEKSLRKAGQDKYADDFVLTMNRAAEKAVPIALEQFEGAISAMTLDDANKILSGPDDAATAYFREHAEKPLRERFLPIVKEATDAAGVTAAYKEMTSYAGGFSSFFSKQAIDVDEYVTEQTLDGLFQMVAAEEARIRTDPVARTSELLEQVFGARK